MCAMLLQEDAAKIAALNMRLKKEQKGKAAAEVSFATSCLVASCHAFTKANKLCLHQQYACVTFVSCKLLTLTQRHLPLYCCLGCDFTK